MHGLWNTPANAWGRIIETHREMWHFPLVFSAVSLQCRARRFLLTQLQLYTRANLRRLLQYNRRVSWPFGWMHSFPVRPQLTFQSVGSLKHTHPRLTLSPPMFRDLPFLPPLPASSGTEHGIFPAKVRYFPASRRCSMIAYIERVP